MPDQSRQEKYLNKAIFDNEQGSLSKFAVVGYLSFAISFCTVQELFYLNINQYHEKEMISNNLNLFLNVTLFLRQGDETASCVVTNKTAKS